MNLKKFPQGTHEIKTKQNVEIVLKTMLASFSVLTTLPSVTATVQVRTYANSRQ